MTTGSGLFLSADEKDPLRQNHVIRQLIEGRSNAVGVVTLTDDDSATTTTVTAITCGPNSVVLMFPQTAHAAAALTTTYVKGSDISSGQFIVSHSATSQSDQTFMWLCIG